MQEARSLAFAYAVRICRVAHFRRAGPAAEFGAQAPAGAARPTSSEEFEVARGDLGGVDVEDVDDKIDHDSVGVGVDGDDRVRSSAVRTRNAEKTAAG